MIGRNNFWLTGDTLIYLDGYFATTNESYSTQKLIIQGVQEWYGFFFYFKHNFLGIENKRLTIKKTF